MFRQYRYFVIKDGAKIMSINENQEIFWIDDPRQSCLFLSHLEAESFRRKNLKNLEEEFHHCLAVKPIIILYFEL